ncbi:MAG: hypothetical protein Q4A01_06490 [Coriobacteriales bacterium]|nr:hypothetical protein [Coriobacteriales bacterium]
MEFEDLTPEQQEQLKACTTQEELMDLADELDLDLAPEHLEAISGGLNKNMLFTWQACRQYL